VGRVLATLDVTTGPDNAAKASGTTHYVSRLCRMGFYGHQTKVSRGYPS
jgi:hypothetical protein